MLENLAVVEITETSDNYCVLCKKKTARRMNTLPVYHCSFCDVSYLEKFTDNETYCLDSAKTDKFMNIDINTTMRLAINNVRGGFLEQCNVHLNGAPIKILDVGCGAGTFLDYAKDKGFATYGCDICERSVKYVKNKGHNCFVSAIDNFTFAYNFFDVITLFDSFEHVNNPILVLQRIYKSLKDSGHIIISTPLRPETMTESWRHFRPDEHNFYFNRKSLHYLCDAAGFKIIAENLDESKVRVDVNNPENIITIIGEKC